MLLLSVLSALTRSFVKGVTATNAIAIPDRLQFTTVLNLCKSYDSLIASNSMDKKTEFFRRAGNSFRLNAM
jgi:hypothetical protein